MLQLARLIARGLQQKAVLRKPLSAILAIQRRRLRALVAHARARSPFYADRLRDIDPKNFELAQLPTVTKTEMMLNFDRFLTDRRMRLADLEAFISDASRLGEWYLGKYAVTRTSGSQGLPAMIVQDRNAMELLFVLETGNSPAFPTGPISLIKRIARRTRLAVVTIGRGFYPSAAGLAYAPEAMKYFVERQWTSRIDPFDELVEQLNRFQPNILLAYASVLEMLAREELAGRMRLARSGELRQVINMSEPLSNGARKLAAAAFKVPITDNYATGECMVLALGCPQGHGMHLQADWVVMEVVDRHHRPVEPGRAGDKILLTNLYNSVQPFIRYEVNDVVTMSPQPCPCGNPMPLVLSVGGRTDEVLWIREGDHLRQVHPYVLSDTLDECPAVGWYQIVQVERNRLELRAAPAPRHQLSPEELKKIMTEGLQRYGLGELIQVDVAVVADIGPDPKTGKLKRVTSRIGPPTEISTSPVPPSSAPTQTALAES